MGRHALLQGIFLTQGSNPCVLHWQADSLPLGPWEAPSKVGTWPNGATKKQESQDGAVTLRLGTFPFTSFSSPFLSHPHCLFTDGELGTLFHYTHPHSCGHPQRIRDRRSEVKLTLWHLLALWPQAGHVTFLDLSFLIFQMKILTSSCLPEF